jgi:tryptophan-rich sensory protein
VNGFRRSDLFTALVISTLAPIFDTALLILVLFVDAAAAWSLVPYLLYRAYAAMRRLSARKGFSIVRYPL